MAINNKALKAAANATKKAQKKKKKEEEKKTVQKKATQKKSSNKSNSAKKSQNDRNKNLDDGVKSKSGVFKSANAIRNAQQKNKTTGMVKYSNGKVVTKNDTGVRSTKSTAGRKGDATKGAIKAASRVSAVGNIYDTMSSAKNIRESSKNKNGKATVSKEQAKAISNWWKSISAEEKRKYINDKGLIDKKAIAKQDKKIDKAYEGTDSRVRGNQLTSMEDYYRLQNALRMPSPELRNAALGEDLQKRLAEQNAFDYARGAASRGALGFMEALSPAPITSGYNYTNKQKNAIRQGKESTAYAVGSGLGFMASAATNAGIGLESAVAKSVLKSSGKTGMAKFAANRGADLIVNSGLDVLDAAKFATDEDGNFDIKDFGERFITNEVLGLAGGAAAEGIAQGLKRLQVKKALQLKNKLEKGIELDVSEKKLLAKINANKAEDNYQFMNDAQNELKAASERGKTQNVQPQKSVAPSVKADNAPGIEANAANTRIKSEDTGIAKTDAPTVKNNAPSTEISSNVTPKSAIQEPKDVKPDAPKVAVDASKTVKEIPSKEQTKLTKRAEDGSVTKLNPKKATAAKVKNSKRPSYTIPRSGESAELSKARDELWTAKKKLKSASIALARSRKKAQNNFQASPKTTIAYNEAKVAERKAYAKLKELGGIAESTRPSDIKRINEMDKINTVADRNSSKRVAKSVDPKSKDGNSKIKKLKDWNAKTENVLSRIWAKTGDTLNPYEQLADMIGGETRKLIQAQTNRLRVVRSIHSGNVTGSSGIRGSRGQIGFDGKRVGDSLDEIMEKAGFSKDNKSKLGGASRQADFDDYCRLKANRDLLISKNAGNEDAKPFMAEYDGMNDELVIAKHDEFISEYEKAYGNSIIQYQQSMVKFARNNLQYAVDGGLVTQKKANALIKVCENYVPSTRAVEASKSFDYDGIDDITTQGAMRKREGSDQDFIPLYDAMASHDLNVIKKTEVNKLFQIIHESDSLKHVTDAEFRELQDSLTDDEIVNAYKNVVWIKEDGNVSNISFFEADTDKMVTIPIPKAAAKAISEWSGEEQLALYKLKSVKATSEANQLFKNLITGWDVTFGVRNFGRDIQTAAVNTQNGVFNYFRNVPRALIEITSNGDLYKLYKANGGKYATNISDGESKLNAIRKMASSNASPLKWLEEFNNVLEAVPRFTEFCASAEKNLEDVLGTTVGNARTKAMVKNMNNDVLRIASSDARDVTVNFARHGAISKLLNNTFVPYFNPSLQGLHNIYRVGKNAFYERGWRGLATYATKLLGMSAAAGLAYEYIMRDNKDYQQLSSYVKNTNFCIPLGDGVFFKVPKARDISALSVVPLHVYRRAFLETPDGTVVDAFKTSTELVGTVNPITDNLFSPLYRLYTGKTWYGGDIETGDDKDLIKLGKSNEVWDENTSALAIELGNQEWAKKLKLSPKRIDSALDGYTGLIYDFGISQSSLAGKKDGKVISPLLNRFTVDSVVKNQNASNFYEKADKMYSIKSYYESKNKTSSKEYKDADEWIKKYGYTSSTFSYAINKVQMSSRVNGKKISDKEKYEYVRKLKMLQNEVQKAGIKGDPVKVDAYGKCADILGTDAVFGDKEMMRKSGNTPNTHYDAYNNLKSSSKFNSASSAQKKKYKAEFLNDYKRIANAEIESGGSTLYPNYSTVAIATELSTSSNTVKNAYKKNIYDSTAKNAKTYVASGGTIRSWTKSLTALNNGAKKCNAEYLSDLSSGAKALALANSKVKQNNNAFIGAGLEKKTNAARWGNKLGITEKQFEAFYDKNNINTYTRKEELMKYIDGESWIDSKNKKAVVYALIMNAKNTPYGTVPTFTETTDVSFASSGGGGRGYRRYSGHGYRRYSRHRGSGGSSKGGEGSYSAWLKKNGVSQTASSASSLSEAFRKKQLKALQASSGNKQ